MPVLISVFHESTCRRFLQREGTALVMFAYSFIPSVADDPFGETDCSTHGIDSKLVILCTIHSTKHSLHVCLRVTVQATAAITHLLRFQGKPRHEAGAGDTVAVAQTSLGETNRIYMICRAFNFYTFSSE